MKTHLLIALALPLAIAPVWAQAPIVVNINGEAVPSDPAPTLVNGSVYVPLRGVLENLGAKVDYFGADQRVEITQKGQKYILRLATPNATVGTQIVPLAPSRLIGKSAFVPLRSLAQLFGYQVAWLSATRTVAISEGIPTLGPVNRRQALLSAGSFGVGVDITKIPVEAIPALLDNAKASGAGLIKARFDWDTLQPTPDPAFNWAPFDALIKAARERNLIVVGILGNSAQWASVSLAGTPEEKRQTPPRVNAYLAWSNYVSRVAKRYARDVQAWQVWENPNSRNFRSVAKNYRILTANAIETARQADPTVIIHAADSNGLSLDFLAGLSANGTISSSDGVQVFPVASWQPNTLAALEEFLAPYAVLREQLAPKDSKKRDFWVGGVQFPLNLSENAPTGFSETDAADYLVKSLSLGLAASAEKVFYQTLRDAPDADVSRGEGLFRADGSARPSALAFKQLASALGNKPFVGALGGDQNATILFFDDKENGTVVAWGQGQLLLSSSGEKTELPGAVFVATRPDSIVTDATGQVVARPDGALTLSARPVLISNVARETLEEIVAPGPLRPHLGGKFAGASEIRASFATDGIEDGLYWRKYLNFGGMAERFVKRDEREWLTTQAQRSILDLQSQKPFIYLDVTDDFLYNAPGQNVTVEVEVLRPPVTGPSIGNTVSGFRVEYDALERNKSTLMQVVEQGEGWITYKFTLPDAQFADAQGYDLLINTGGSSADLTFGSIVVRKEP